MKKIFFCLALLIAISSCKGEKYESKNYDSDSTRYPVVAGKFYPDDPVKLTNAIKSFMRDAKPPMVENAVAVIVPHAGYIYSGQIAADAFNQVKQNKYDVVVVLGTNHTTSGFSGMGIYPKGAFATPIGSVQIDNKTAEELMREDSDVKVNLEVHAKEHSVEVQIPFIKYLFPKTEIVPVIVGQSGINVYERFGKALAKVLKDKKALIVASSDLSHYPNFDDALKVDNKTLQTIVGLNLAEIHNVLDNQLDKNISQLVTCACGEAPILAAIAAAKELGANSASIVGYSNSGYSPVGSSESVVGYGAVVIGKDLPVVHTDVDTLISNPDYQLNSSDKKSLLKYARKTLEQYFSSQTVPLPRNMNQMLKGKRGAFVTLRKLGKLRGCIGHMAENTPLCSVVGSMALQAAFNDSRFSPLTQEELPEIEIEISALTSFKEIKNADEIVLGRDGVIVRKGNNQAVFLPQVATETGWNKETFLNQLCYKAGLSADDWKSAKLFTFQADVFSESEFH